MVSNWIKAGVLLIVIAELAACAPKKRVSAQTVVSHKRRASDTVLLAQVFPDNMSEKLVLKPATFPNGVYVCAIENLSKPCLPKLSALVADRLEQKGIVVVTDQSQADATLYFETWFDSFSSYTDMSKGMMSNPAAAGKDFAAKMEQSFATGNIPEVHKQFRNAPDPFSSVKINSNDDQKFIYVAFTTVNMKYAVDYPGEGDKHVGASKNPWVKPGSSKYSWLKAKWTPATRTLIGNYNGETPTEKAATPMLLEGIDLLLERVGQAPKKK
jgi:hypothetical protein